MDYVLCFICQLYFDTIGAVSPHLYLGIHMKAFLCYFILFFYFTILAV